MNCWIYVLSLILYIKPHEGFMQISTNPINATIGMNVAVSCISDRTYILLKKSSGQICFFSGAYENGTCMLRGSFEEKYVYSCTTENIYTVTIPGDLVTTELHKTVWACESLAFEPDLSPIERNYSTLFVNIPISSVTIEAIPIDQNPIQIVNGTTHKFKCTTNAGRPSSKIHWYLSNVDITNSANVQPDVCDTVTGCSDENVISSSMVTLNGQIGYDGKSLYCTAVNTAGMETVTSGNKTIIILYAPDKDPVIYQTPQGPIISGNKTVLTCTVSGGRPMAILSWNCTGHNRSNTSGDTVSHSVEFTVNRTDNNRICTCSASHKVSSYRPHINHILTVYYAPDSSPSIRQSPSEPVVTGANVKLTCSLSGGNPPANLSWDCNGTYTRNMSESTASFSVELKVDKTDNNRTCTCVATHYVNFYRKDVQQQLQVHYAPDSSPTIQQSPIGPIVTGNKVKLTCTLSGGNPLANLSLDCPGAYTQNISECTVSYSVEITVNKTDNNRTCTCTATHYVTNYLQTFEKRLQVYFPPDVSVSRISSTLEKEQLILVCNAIGNPTNYSYQWEHSFRGKTLRNSTDFVQPGSQLRIERLSYEDTGNYTCTAINGMEKDLALNNTASIPIDVEFQPVFVNFKATKTAKIGDNVSLTVDVFANPDVLVPVQWVNESDNSVLTNGSELFITSEKTDLTSYFHGIQVLIDKFSYRLTMQLFGFSATQDGFYGIQVSNPTGNSSKTIKLIISDKPSPPTDFSATIIGSTYVLLSWMPGFNGGNPQIFKITYGILGTKDTTALYFNESLTMQQHKQTIQHLQPSTTYYFYINASNIEGDAVAVNNTLMIQTLNESAISSSVIGPVSGAIVGLVFAAILVLIILLVRRFKGYKVGQSERKPFTPDEKESSDDVELKDNILYISSDTNFQNPSSPSVVNAVVNKSRDNTKETSCHLQESRLSVDSDKNKTTTTNKGNTHRKFAGNKDGKEHENLNTIERNQDRNNDVYENVVRTTHKNKIFGKVNKDGLIYTELVFKDMNRKNGKNVIHGIENRSNYADIDLSLKADPLPSDDSETEDDTAETITTVENEM